MAYRDLIGASGVWEEPQLQYVLVLGSPKQIPKYGPNFVEELRDKLLNTHLQSRTQIKSANHRTKARYDLKANYHGFESSDQVWFYNRQKKRVV